MEILILILYISTSFVFGSYIPNTLVASDINETATANSTDTNKDVYVIHAMVYQVGILTNKTSDENGTNIVGNQEAVTFFHTNGSQMDLSQIPEPLLTNVTAERMVALAPIRTYDETPDHQQIPLTGLQNLVSSSNLVDESHLDLKNPKRMRPARDASDDNSQESDFVSRQYSEYPERTSHEERIKTRSLDESEDKQGGSDRKTPIKILSGAAVIPQDAGIQSVAFPPLLTFNNNFSEIPVPIPNTSVVHYTKVNTLFHKPQKSADTMPILSNE